MKTIKQIADELGVSKQAIRKHVSRLPTTMVSTSANRTMLINDNGQAIIRDQVSTKSSNQQTTSDNHEQDTFKLKFELEQSKKLLELERKNAKEREQIYIEQLKVKDKQLEEDQKTIRQISKAMENIMQSLQAEQALHAGTMKKNHERLPATEVSQSIPDELPKSKKSLWQKVFKRRTGE